MSNVPAAVGSSEPVKPCAAAQARDGASTQEKDSGAKPTSAKRGGQKSNEGNTSAAGGGDRGETGATRRTPHVELGFMDSLMLHQAKTPGPNALGGITCERNGKVEIVVGSGKRKRKVTVASGRVVKLARKKNLVRPPTHLIKYYNQRHRLFHRFHEGVLLDEESWYSVTPEKIAVHHATRFCALKGLEGHPVILDCFGGAGGNSIQFAVGGADVIAVEKDPDRVALAKHNAGVYGVAKHIDFVQADVYAVLRTMRRGTVDAIFFSPPWGGPEYLAAADYDAKEFKPLLDMARDITPNIAMFVPRNTSVRSIRRFLGSCELEENFLSGSHKTTTLYFGDLMGQAYRPN